MTEFTKDVVGYTNKLTVRPGDNLEVMVSCHRVGEYQASLVRLISGDDRPRGTGFAEQDLSHLFKGSYPGRQQAIISGSYLCVQNMPELAQCSFTSFVFPTLLETDWRVIFHGPFRVMISEQGVSVARADSLVPLVVLAMPMLSHRWYRVLCQVTGESQNEIRIECERMAEGAGETTTRHSVVVDENEITEAIISAHNRGQWLLACAAPGDGHFNGRIEAPRIVEGGLKWSEAEVLLGQAVPVHPRLVVAWDFSQGINTQLAEDVSGHSRTGYLYQTPTRGVPGVNWDGTVQNWQEVPAHYGAVHFHEDDLTDAEWQVDFSWQLPEDLHSGIYALKLIQGQSEDYLPLFVSPAQHQSAAPVALLISTATYLAYANQRLGLTDGPFGNANIHNANDAYLLAHPEVGLSLYEYHRDGSGVHFSSALRPILNLRPKSTPWAFCADTNLTAWLEAIDQPFDVITDEDLHLQADGLLNGYRCVITSTHPEYYSTTMLQSLQNWLGTGGRLMYMGGNGFYWRIAFDPNSSSIIEVRRAEGGTRAWIAEPGAYYHQFSGEYGGMWRRLGQAPNKTVGIGFAAQGFDGGTYYRWQPDALSPRASFIMQGVEGDELLGNFGTQGGGAAGEEIDRFDTSLGSPAHALVLASSENHRPGMLRVVEEVHMTEPLQADDKVRADMVFFETANGGAVFSTGSISYAGALSHNQYDNDIAKLTGNVLWRFIEDTPFDPPL